MGASDVGIVEMLEIGSSLREARLRQGLGLVDVQAATMIRVRYLEALENERFDVLPEGSYRRSFLREYAEFLGLNGDVYAAEYELRVAEREAPLPAPRSRLSTTRRLSRLPPARTAAVAAAAVLLGVVVWQIARPARTVKSPPPPAMQAPTPTQPRTHAQHPPAGAKPLPVRSPPVLALTAAGGGCWLLVRIGSSAGRTIYERTLEQGQTVRFGLRKPLWIRLGAPWNLDATISRRPVTVGLPSRTGDILATAAGLRPTS
jgi:hypothetical protein